MSDPTLAGHKDQSGMDGDVCARIVIGLEIASIRRCLVHVGKAHRARRLEFEDEYCAAKQENNVGPAKFHWQLVFEDRGVSRRGWIVVDDLTELALKGRD